MEKAQVIKLRNLYKDAGYIVTCDNMKIFTNKAESDDSLEYVLWDDANEVVYIICPNTVPTQTTDSRLYPMSVKVMDYASIEMIGTVLDRLCLDNLLKAKVSEGLTNEETRKRYYKQMTDLWDERTYFMGQESPTTEKRGLRPDDEIVDKNATRFL